MMRRRRISAMVLAAVLLVTTILPLSTVTQAEETTTPTDVTGLLNPTVTVSKDGVEIPKNGNLDSRKSIDVTGSFKVPVLGDGLADSASVKQGDTADILIAKDVILKNTSSTYELVYWDQTAAKNIKVGTLTYRTLDGSTGIEAHIVFDGDSEVFAPIQQGCSYYHDVSCTFTLSLSYQEREEETGQEKQEIVILGITYYVVLPGGEIGVTGTKTAKRTGNQIQWQVQLNGVKEQDNTPAALDGFTFADDLSKAGTFVAGSFKIGTSEDSALAKEILSDTENGITALSYTFPEGTGNSCYLFYQTTIPDQYYYSTKASAYTNTATVSDGSVELWTGDAEVDLTGQWIKKEVEVNKGDGYITWSITANTDSATLPGAVITDNLDEELKWVSATYSKLKTDQTWEVVKNITTDPQGKYELGDISGPVKLEITASYDTTNTGHKQFTVKNTATLTWEGRDGSFGSTVTADIGMNGIAKEAVSYNAATHKQTWKTTVTQSDVSEGLYVTDLLVYGTAAEQKDLIANLKAGTYQLKAVTAGAPEVNKEIYGSLEPSYNQKYVADSFAAVTGSSLEGYLYQVMDGNTAVADLLMVTGPSKATIPVTTEAQSFTLQSEVTNKSMYLRNFFGTGGSSLSLTNYTDLFSSNNLLADAQATSTSNICILEKDCLTAASGQKDMSSVTNVNASAGSSTNSYNYQEESAVFRIQVNRSQIPVNETVTVVDQMPTGWTLQNFTDGTTSVPFYLYEATPYSENTRKLTATTLVTQYSNFLSYKINEETNQITFQFKNLSEGQSYLIVLKGGPTKETIEASLTSGTSSTTARNQSDLYVGDTWYANDWEDVVITRKLLTKSMAKAENGVLNWQIDYNPYGQSYQDPVITDVIPEGIVLRQDDTIVIQELNYNAAGTLTLGKEITQTEGMVTYDGTTRTLSIHLPDGSQGYRITYLTDVIGEVGLTVVNSATLSRTSYASTTVTSQYVLQKADVSASMSKSGWILVYKINEQEEALSGAQFTLYDESKEEIIQTGVTDQNGDLYLTGLNIGTYYLKETDAPDGYAESETWHKVVVAIVNSVFTVTIDDQIGDGANQLLVMDEKLSIYVPPIYVPGITPAVVNLTAEKRIDGEAPDGEEFSFTLTQADQVLQTKTNQGGTITFDPLTFTSAGIYQFQIQELAGTDEKIDYDDTIYTVTITVTQENYVLTAAVMIKQNQTEYTGTPIFNNTTKTVEIQEEPVPQKPTPQKPTPEKPKTPTTPNTPSPLTGDVSLLWFWVALALIAGAGIWGLIRVIKKDRTE